MEFSRFKKKRKPNYKKFILLVVALGIIILLWKYADTLLKGIF
jgi:hypothetical protein